MGCWHLDYLPLLHQPVIQTWPGSSAYSPRLLRLHGGVELRGYQLCPVAVWSGGQESGPLCRMLTTERSVVLKVAMFLSRNPSQQSTVCFHLIPLRLIARWNGNSFLCEVAVNLKHSLLDGFMEAAMSTVWIPSCGVKKRKQFALFVLEFHLDDAEYSCNTAEHVLAGLRTIFLADVWANPPLWDNLCQIKSQLGKNETHQPSGSATIILDWCRP